MLCVFFKIRTKNLLKEHMGHLIHLHDDFSKAKNIRKRALLYLSIIFKAIAYASGCPKSEFNHLRGNNKDYWGTKKFTVIDPNTNELLCSKGIKLIKNIGKNNRPEIKNAPIFEIRVNNIERINVGFRCIFFVVHHYECYTSPFYKDKYNNYEDQLNGKIKTDIAAGNTYIVYKQYISNPKEFSSMFTPDNLILNFMTKGN